jgi:Flp pilus assembly protein TadG
MIEFVLTIMTTLLLIFGLVDFGRAVYTASVLQWAAQYGARAAIIEWSNEKDEAAAQAAAEAAVVERLTGLDTDAVTVEPLVWTGNVVSVGVSYPFEFIAPIVAQITGESIEMTSSASMVAY